MVDPLPVVQANLESVQERIADAAERSGRPANAVRLVAVTKYAQMDWVRALIECGHNDLGENRPQQLVSRQPELPETITWHMIGQLQRNKVRPVLNSGAFIHSVDSMRLLERIELLAGELNRQPRILLEVNVSGEESKSGFRPDELRSVWPEIQESRQSQISGLMTMAPMSEDVESARSVFRNLRLLRDELRSSKTPLPELSMGMSGDFEVAIEEGASLVRIGSRLFAGLER